MKVLLAVLMAVSLVSCGSAEYRPRNITSACYSYHNDARNYTYTECTDYTNKDEVH